MKMNSIQEIIDDIRNGKMVILIDDEDRENEGDLILAADFVTPDAINFMATQARGLICLSLEPQQIDRLGLPLMVGDERNHSPNKTAFTVSIEAADGVSTGISASDRSHTIRVASNPKARPQDIIMPGHIFPIRAQKGGVLKRAGHTEASVDLARLAGLNPAAVICEVMKNDGTMARLPDLLDFAKQHNLKIGTIEELIRYRLENETLIEEVSSGPIETQFGLFQMRVFKNCLDQSHSFVLQKGFIEKNQPTMVRVHVENSWGDLILSPDSQKGLHYKKALQLMSESSCGVFVYLRKEGAQSSIAKWRPGQGSQGTQAKMDPREYGIGAQILRELGIGRIHLLGSQKNAKVVGLKGFGLEIEKIVTIDTTENDRDDQQHESFFTSFLK
jgi:3,4-dihydroxy 2-butanone 4-phosphate synthase / GTP cyclohydrolase II